MNSPLQLNNYLLEELVIKANPSFDPAIKDGRKEGKLTCTLSAFESEKPPNRFKITIAVSLKPSSETPAMDPYCIDVRMSGYFGFRENVKHDVMLQMVNYNGSSILYGLIRGFVTQTTAIGQFGKYILPTINLKEVVDKGLQEQTAEANGLKTKGGRKTKQKTSRK
jgi:preprotein translocase subunit SecB